MARRPDVIVFLADDLGFSDIGCYGGEISTPNLDALGTSGTRYTNFCNTARCSPSRASLLTGRHPHETGIGVLTGDRRPHGYPGDLDPSIPTLPEVLRTSGYRTGMVGKWHLSKDLRTPSASWPTRRGFEFFYGTISGTSSYYRPSTLMRGEELVEHEAREDPGFYYTTAIANEGAKFISQVSRDEPLFLYVAFTAPHWPLHVPEHLVEQYEGRYADGWDILRQERFERQKAMGLFAERGHPSPRDPDVPAWEDAQDPEWEQRRMEVYAAQVTAMDDGIGQILGALDERGTRDNALLMFLSDNGASAEEIPVGDPEVFKDRTELFNRLDKAGREVQLGNRPEIVPGPESTYASYGKGWANVSNTPFRRFKKWVHLGGVATPLIISWPRDTPQREVHPPGGIDGTPAQLTAIAPTVLDAVGIQEPSMTRWSTSLTGPRPAGSQGAQDALFWEHCGNAAVRRGGWKLTREFRRPWELYNLTADPFEESDIADTHPDLVDELAARWTEWAETVGVIPFEQVVDGVVTSGLDAQVAER